MSSSRLGTLTDKAVTTAKSGLPKPLSERSTSRTIFSIMSTRVSIWEADSNVIGMTKPTCVIAWTLHKRHSLHLWFDHRLSRNMKRMLHHLSVCSTLTHKLGLSIFITDHVLLHSTHTCQHQRKKADERA